MHQRSFTLIEILVAIAIFTLVVAITTGLFISSIMVHRRSLASQTLLDETGYAFEYISRALRMARKDLEGNCLTAKNNYALIAGRLRFLNYQGKCEEFFLEGGQLNKAESEDATPPTSGQSLPLTSANLFVEKFNINPSGSWDQDDALQPRVTLSLTVKVVGQKPEAQPELEIQTTISQRNLDVPQ